MSHHVQVIEHKGPVSNPYPLQPFSVVWSMGISEANNQSSRPSLTVRKYFYFNFWATIHPLAIYASNLCQEKYIKPAIIFGRNSPGPRMSHLALRNLFLLHFNLGVMMEIQQKKFCSTVYNLRGNTDSLKMPI